MKPFLPRPWHYWLKEGATKGHTLGRTWTREKRKPNLDSHRNTLESGLEDGRYVFNSPRPFD